MKRTIVIFSGFNQRAIVAFVRTLVKNDLDFHIIALCDEDPILLSEYRNHVSAVRKSFNLDLADIMLCLGVVKEKANTDRLFIAPSSEALNRFLLKHRNELEQLGCEIPLVDEELYCMVSDKASFGKLCQEFGICIPKEVRFEKTNIPFVVKPKSYDLEKRLQSPVIVDSNQTFLSVEFNESDYYCQEYLNGNSFYLLYYFSKSKKAKRLFQENLLQQPQGKHILAARLLPTMPDDERFVKMFQSIGFFGLVMVEVRIVDGEMFMIEANPRFWGPSQLFVDCGYNLFDCFLEDNGFDVEHKNIVNQNALYFWRGGLSDNVVCHNVKDFDIKNYYEYDVYKRNDTMEIYKKELVNQLTKDYNNVSKHSHYQVLPSLLTKYINQSSLSVKSRAEHERFKYIKESIDLKGKSVLDIGANTGFFSFEAIEAGAATVVMYEGNKEHANFLRTAIGLLGLDDKMEVRNVYYSFSSIDGSNVYDICFLLNVLHHLGDDYGDNSLNVEQVKAQMISQLNSMSYVCKTLVFQLGFNWKGNRDACLFKDGTKREMIEFIKSGSSEYWDIVSIGIAVKKNGTFVYHDLDENNIERIDAFGEFLNRPLFIMKSKLR